MEVDEEERKPELSGGLRRATAFSSTYLEHAEWCSLKIALGGGQSPGAVVALLARPTELLICDMKEKAEAFGNAWRLAHTAVRRPDCRKGDALWGRGLPASDSAITTGVT
jgi:hypothetical protein